ncbi:hypothetical protein P154DRAFT_569391 [Amniculicola lignicola CBS 123094]|uniref:Uncharacterized protein n=1 Tax=Amniculicola lignicola CBS 123094 TaxID=1392246 RepID=A0A6A5X3N6_9PLEO|nr:hypothetical protein P154DRAFT_569391 [Amniculicola lignicola CBS 123094]
MRIGNMELLLGEVGLLAQPEEVKLEVLNQTRSDLPSPPKIPPRPKTNEEPFFLTDFTSSSAHLKLPCSQRPPFLHVPTPNHPYLIRQSPSAPGTVKHTPWFLPPSRSHQEPPRYSGYVMPQPVVYSQRPPNEYSPRSYGYYPNPTPTVTSTQTPPAAPSPVPPPNSYPSKPKPSEHISLRPRLQRKEIQQYSDSEDSDEEWEIDVQHNRARETKEYGIQQLKTRENGERQAETQKNKNKELETEESREKQGETKEDDDDTVWETEDDNEGLETEREAKKAQQRVKLRKGHQLWMTHQRRLKVGVQVRMSTYQRQQTKV